ncbi:MAG: hypothetical protein H6739_14350 [Alphaproteobacteria bacterium]|nr:hypothetical protein [Alphaproteobacteria bacterium]
MSAANQFNKLTNTLANAPVAEMVSNLGLAIAKAQAALDKNSIAVAREMAATEIQFGDDTFNLIQLGFAPTFYAFTDATIEVKLTFSMKDEQSIGVSTSASGTFFMVSASFEASYSRKFSFEASGSSSIAAKIVSLPPPATFLEVLNRFHASNDGGQGQQTQT